MMDILLNDNLKHQNNLFYKTLEMLHLHKILMI